MSANASLAVVVTSPTTCTCPVVTRVSTATRDLGSAASSESSTESLMASQILSGWPSVTDSLVNSRALLTVYPFQQVSWANHIGAPLQPIVQLRGAQPLGAGYCRRFRHEPSLPRKPAIASTIRL